MLTLLQNAACCACSHGGQNDLLIAAGRIEQIAAAGSLARSFPTAAAVDCSGLKLLPGLVDQHVHILGGGGEQGFASRIAEIAAEEVLSAGVTTLVGLLGADGCTRALESLYAKAAALGAQGITAFLYSGSYALPAVTLTGSMTRDLVLIDRVLGAGEIALSDHRSSQPGPGELLALASEVHLGGMLGGKAGVLHLHIGDGKGGLSPLRRVLEQSDLPAEMFVPTHINRSETLFQQGIAYCRAGGCIDLTAGETAGVPVPKAVRRLLEAGCPSERITVSSDANGSVPQGGVTRISALYDDIVGCVAGEGVAETDAFALASKNAARRLKLFPKKGDIAEGSDADLILTDEHYGIRAVMSGGIFRINRGVA